MEEPPFVPTTDSPNRIDPQLDLLVPTNPNQPYDMKELILSVADDQNFFEIQEEYAKNIIIGYIRLNGKTIGVVANQPAALASRWYWQGLWILMHLSRLPVSSVSAMRLIYRC